MVTSNQIEVPIVVKDGFSASLGKLGDKANEAGKAAQNSANGLSASLQGNLGQLVSIAALAGVAKSAIKEATEAANANLSFTSAMNAMGDKDIEGARANLEALGKQFSLEGDAMLAFGAKVQNATGLAQADIAKLVPIVQGMAVSSGKSFEETSQGMQMALLGMEKGVKQYGISLDGATTPQERLSLIIAQSGKYASTAAQEAETAQAKIRAANNLLKDSLESIGTVLLNTVTLWDDASKMLANAMYNIPENVTSEQVGTDTRSQIQGGMIAIESEMDSIRNKLAKGEYSSAVGNFVSGGSNDTRSSLESRMNQLGQDRDVLNTKLSKLSPEQDKANQAKKKSEEEASKAQLEAIQNRKVIEEQMNRAQLDATMQDAEYTRQVNEEELALLEQKKGMIETQLTAIEDDAKYTEEARQAEIEANNKKIQAANAELQKAMQQNGIVSQTKGGASNLDYLERKRDRLVTKKGNTTDDTEASRIQEQIDATDTQINKQTKGKGGAKRETEAKANYKAEVDALEKDNETIRKTIDDAKKSLAESKKTLAKDLKDTSDSMAEVAKTVAENKERIKSVETALKNK